MTWHKESNGKMEKSHNDQIKEDATYGAGSTTGKNYKFPQHFNRKIPK
jgi:hypothetical protein